MSNHETDITIAHKKFKWSRKIALIAIVILIISLLFYGGAWFMESYEPDMLSLIAMQSTDKVSVEATEDYIAFFPMTSDTQMPGLLFYPGAKVEPEAYALMAHRLAEVGIPVIIAKMPFNFAVFDPDKAMALKRALGIADTWAIGGHSLGGSMAAKVAHENPDAFNGLILFASYPGSDLSQSALNVFSISGSLDGLVTKDKLNAKKAYLPPHALYYEIEGGNHAQFGNYGPQKKDNQASISSEAQMAKIVDKVVEFMGGLK